jgi:hypothetical protein
MSVTHEIRIAARGVGSLVWDGESLVDWVGGGDRYFLDGEVASARRRYAYAFDAVASLDGSPFSVIYTRCGTKGLVLRDGRLVREINRSYYQAGAYEYRSRCCACRRGGRCWPIVPRAIAGSSWRISPPASC